jgi:hypothetical protein
VRQVDRNRANYISGYPPFIDSNENLEEQLYKMPKI